MDLFKSFTLAWWQMALLKVGLLAVGIVIGTYWHGFFRKYVPVLIGIAVVTLVYVTYVWVKQ